MKGKRKVSIWGVELSHRFKIVFFLISIIPMALLTYLSVAYVFPALSAQHRRILIPGLTAVIYLVLFLSVLGYFILRKSTNQVLDQMARNNRELSHLLNITRIISSTIQLDSLLERIIGAATEMVEAEAGSILLYNSEKDELNFQMLRGIPPGELEEKVVKLGEGISGTVAFNREPMIVDTLHSDSPFQPYLERFSGYRVTSVVSVPLVFQDELAGVLELYNKLTGDSFTPRDEELLLSLASQAAISIKNVEFREDQKNYFTHITKILINALENNEVWEGHLENVARWSDIITRKLALPEEERRDIHFGALLHDIGILRLGPTSKLKEKMKREHPVIGEKMIRPITIWRKVAPLILYHHERYDGKGYPHGIKGEDIPLGARIIAVAEAFDTMTNLHSYNRKGSLDEARIELIENAGTQFDPEIVKVFLKTLDEEKQTPYP